MQKWKALAREPLVQFLILGTLLFLLDAYAGKPDAKLEGRIVVSTDDIQRLATTWQLQWQRPPTEQELAALIRSYVREEVFYREAMAMGLDRDDTVIRRRLAQKMDFLSDDIAEQQQPAEAELSAWFERNRERYRLSARLSLLQVYLSRDQRGAAAEADAQTLLQELARDPETADPWMKGDRFLLPYEVRNQSQEELARVFGAEFAERVVELTPGFWQGPIPSGYGLHLVRVSARVAPRIPALDEVRARVLQDFQDERRRQVNAAFYRSLRERYRIEIEDPRWSARVAELEAETTP